jgi:hypothetical protein
MFILFFKIRLYHAEIIVANSQDTKDQLLLRYPWIESKLLIIPYTKSLHSIKPKKPQWDIPSQYILIINTIEPRKNIKNMLYALKELKDKYRLK